MWCVQRAGVLHAAEPPCCQHVGAHVQGVVTPLTCIHMQSLCQHVVSKWLACHASRPAAGIAAMRHARLHRACAQVLTHCDKAVLRMASALLRTCKQCWTRSPPALYMHEGAATAVWAEARTSSYSGGGRCMAPSSLNTGCCDAILNVLHVAGDLACVGSCGWQSQLLRAVCQLAKTSNIAP